MARKESKWKTRNLSVIITLWRDKERYCIPEASTSCYGNRLIREEKRAPRNLKSEQQNKSKKLDRRFEDNVERIKPEISKTMQNQLRKWYVTKRNFKRQEREGEIV